jgi:Transposase
MICAAIVRCAGIDVGKKFLSVCIMTGPLEGEAHVERRRFGTMTAELEALGDWLKAEAITHVVMEPTGSYWKPVYNVLEESVKVYLANPQEHTGVGPLLQSRKSRNSQRHSAEQFPDPQDHREIRRIPQTLDEFANPGHSQDIPCASQNEFEDDHSSGYPISNDLTTRN